MIGTSLRHYRIVEVLGSGGMGEVYVAEDTKLGRRVALKLLSAELAASPERRQRFEREAQAVAALDHSNIVTIHSIEEGTPEGGDSPVHFITMRLIEGRTLGELIPSGGMALDRFFGIAVPLVEAIAAAHRRGITHRDLKPSNVMITDDGTVKVLDFGLAKLVADETAEAATHLPTQQRAEPLTDEGKILGTVAYMSPEQAEGREIDHRTDIFSLGIILYEMATGKRPFEGDTKVSLMSSIVKDTPRPVTEIKRTLPRHLGRIVKRALEKGLQRRYQSALDLRNDLAELREDVESGEAVAVAAGSAPEAAAGARWSVLAGVAAVVVLAGLGAYLWLGGRWAPTGPTTLEFTTTQLTFGAERDRFPSLSPDGNWFVYQGFSEGDWDIYLQSISGQNPINLTQDSARADAHPAFSPDGQQIAFRSWRQGGGVFIMGVTGEAVQKVVDDGFHPAWSPDGETLAYSTEELVRGEDRGSLNSEVWVVDLASGASERLAGPDAAQPSFSPSGRWIAYWGLDHAAVRDLWIVSRDGGEPIQLTDDPHLDWNPVWARDGSHIYFLSSRGGGGGSDLWRLPIDETDGRVLGRPEPVRTPAAYAAHLSLSADGRKLAYVAMSDSGEIFSVAIDPETLTTEGDPVSLRGMSRAPPGWLHVSPDGSRVVMATTGSAQEDLFIMNTDGSGFVPLTDDPARDRWPRWWPRRDSILFYSDRSGTYQIWTIQPDGGRLRQLTDADRPLIHPTPSPDGERIAYFDVLGNTSRIFDPDVPWSQQTPEELPPMNDDGDYFDVNDWSPDGDWLAGERWIQPSDNEGSVLYSLDSGSYRVISETGGTVAWLADGERLIYSDREELHAWDIHDGYAGLVFSPSHHPIYTFALSPDNRTLYVVANTRTSDVWLLEFE